LKARRGGMRHRAAVLAFGLAFFLIGAGPAAAAIQVSITSPTDGAQSLQGVAQVAVTASADDGIFSVQLYVDGQPSGIASTLPVSQYQYAIPWDTSTVAPGDHTLTVLATDWSLGLLTQMSGPVHVDVGPAFPTVHLTSPASWTFVRGSTPISVTSTSAVAPASVAYALDGAPIASPWNTTAAADGLHMLTATITDGRGKVGSDSEPVVVDNTAPTTSVTAPSANASATGSLSAKANASDAFGIQGVQFAIDGAVVGTQIAQPDLPGGYIYSATLDISKLASGAHVLTNIASDGAGNKATSAGVTFNVGSAPPAATVTSPLDWSLAAKTVTVTANVTGAAGPFSAQLLVDGAAVGFPDTTAPYTFQWDTTKAVGGSHTVAVSVKDSLNRTGTSAALHETVDNTAPTAIMFQPSANARITGPATLQVSASDAYGVKSVQLRVDGAPVGALLTAPDPGQLYLYTTTYDTSQLAAGSHAVSAVVTDNAGNTATPAPVTIVTGPIRYLPVLNYHSIAALGGSIYDQTPTEADQQLAYLKANGYQAVTLEQYQQWLTGANIGVAKPVLITVDDGLTDELAWDALLQKYGMKGVLFVVTGFADNTTPGDTKNNMSWTTIHQLAGNGRWQMAFHAGQYGHGDQYAAGSSITLNATQTLALPAACPYFYSCLGTITTTTTTGFGRNQKTTTTTAPESVATFKTLVSNEVNAGLAELKQKVPSASLLAWAAPFNDDGQWTNLYNDPSGQVQTWMAGFFASKLPIVFTQTNPVDFGQAAGTVGSLTGLNRHYRFEVHTDTTIAQFATALQDPAFGR
jgi:Bacterial Ig domain